MKNDVLDLQDGTIEVFLNHGVTAIIDKKDMAAIQPFNWYAKLSSGQWYACAAVYDKTTGRARTIWMHRLILPGVRQVDHANHNSRDNRRENLRPCTQSQNRANSLWNVKTKTSRHKGVALKGNRWRAQIRVGGHDIHLGYFSSEVAAAHMYDQAAREHFGEFALCNFVASIAALAPTKGANDGEDAED